MSRERQEAWLEGEQALAVARLTRDLRESFRDLRKVRRGEPAPGTFLEGGKFERRRPGATL
jgi:hypothetical protein